ncbi:MAG: alpha-galactosidase, partial [Pacificimonas sp.]
YRAHPDWALPDPAASLRTQRHQLQLDLTKAEVKDHLFVVLDKLLSGNDIAYLKWDHNRPAFPHAADRRAQVTSVYALIDRLRAAHAAVEIEGCASGGGRIDYEMLRRTDRVWPSDNNDPIERLRIMTAWSQFLPLRVLGNHVGPSPNPITGRRTAIDFRAKVALFGHMGVEADPGAMSLDERETLAAHIALYQDWRDVIHGGRLSVLYPDKPDLWGFCAATETRAFALVASTAFAADFVVPPAKLTGLAAGVRWHVTLPEPWPEKAANYLPYPDRWRDGVVISSEALATVGLSLPLAHPETAWLIALDRVI